MVIFNVHIQVKTGGTVAVGSSALLGNIVRLVDFNSESKSAHDRKPQRDEE
jgi:hypothetical protein